MRLHRGTQSVVLTLLCMHLASHAQVLVGMLAMQYSTV